MNDLISPKYQMKLVDEVEAALWNEFPTSKYVNVRYYVEKWQSVEFEDQYRREYNFDIINQPNSTNIDLKSTLHKIDGETLLKIAIDLDVDTPDFIPSVPVFKNTLKSDYKTAHNTFIKAYKQIETDPDFAIGLANSALESIIKEILKDGRINSKIKAHETLYKLTEAILKELALYPNSNMPEEVKTIGSSLLASSKGIEGIRSKKTNFHGKTNEDIVITEPLYAYFIVNAISTIGIFLISFYKTKFPKVEQPNNEITNINDNLPF